MGALSRIVAGMPPRPSLQRAWLPVGLALAGATWACATPPVSVADPTHLTWTPRAAAHTPEQTLRDVPWQTMGNAAFEAWLPSVAALLAAELDALADLAATSDDPTSAATALRATLILARLDQEAAAARLADQLEARQPHAERYADAADVTAAAYLGTSSFAASLDLAARLAQLVDDASAHPDLEVRTECARAALLLGNDTVGPFLLRLTRLGTRLGAERDGDWHSSSTTSWARSRAAEALAERLGIASPYRGDASLAQREAAALTLEAAWRDR